MRLNLCVSLPQGDFVTNLLPFLPLISNKYMLLANIGGLKGSRKGSKGALEFLHVLAITTTPL